MVISAKHPVTKMGESSLHTERMRKEEGGRGKVCLWEQAKKLSCEGVGRRRGYIVVVLSLFLGTL